MGRVTYPQYRVTQWLDNSDESMLREQATIIYGVQTMRHKGGRWMHVCRDSEPLFFDTREEASAACAELRKGEAVVA